MEVVQVSWRVSATLAEKFPEFTALTVYGSTEEPLFVGNDIKELLELQKINYYRYEEGLDYVKKDIVYGGIVRNMVFFTESGLYNIVFKHRGPVGRKFRMFVTSALKELRLQGSATLENVLDGMKNLEIASSNTGQKQVYIIGQVGGECYKIGHSEDPISRLRNLSTGSSFRLRLEWVFPTNITEREVHAYADAKGHLRTNGEWFNMTSDDIDEVIKYFSETS